MSNQFTAGAVVYARNTAKVSAFYAEIAGLHITHAEQDHVVLESAAFQLVVVAVPARIAATIQVASPPQPREDTAIKLVLPIASIASARVMAPSLGGQLNPPEREWQFQGSSVCDGHDPEGNVVQFREVAP
ncbi:glyoxalase/bleomycin resistance/dioxygenase family protein [Rhodanobacter umsongensis]|uniref:Glyoxalase/bleomycin resistance/dioxygenase family protein n=1 Tax=Rhodanobacter umsongensis TaxID=633153 RepID=A0ABW0JMA5_9GAMM